MVPKRAFERIAYCNQVAIRQDMPKFTFVDERRLRCGRCIFSFFLGHALSISEKKVMVAQDVLTFLNVSINGGTSVSRGAPFQGATSFSQFVGFGDSNTDTGYFFSHPSPFQGLFNEAVAVGGGLQTDIGSRMNTTVLAQAFGLTAIPIGQPGGTNYAASAAVVNAAGTNALAPSIVSQIDTFLGSNQSIDAGTLFYISGGGNSATIANNLFPNSLSNRQSYMAAEAHALSAAIQRLYDHGARYFVIDDQSGGGAISRTFNATLYSDLEQANIQFVAADDRSLIRNMTNSAAPYGLTNVVRPPAGPFDPTTNPYDPANGGGTINPRPYTNANGNGVTLGWAR
jgi:phospholipase/lecithinase/hemolysin